MKKEEIGTERERERESGLTTKTFIRKGVRR